MGSYPKISYELGQDTSVLQCNRVADKTIAVRPRLPGNIIVVHGVNDVGTGYDQVEQGLCEGLKKRIGWSYIAGSYRMPVKDDKDKLIDDPDAVFFKRKTGKDTHSPVIPFYWGFREERKQAKTRNGQDTDRYYNRLDKDLSKGGGAFGNATSTLPDLWNRGVGAPADIGGDPVRPLLNGPGRLYMVLAAQRLAALIAMIRDYDPNEAVSIVAHSQGGMLSLLAQAFLLDRGERPADTLVLAHPPYSLVDDAPWKIDVAECFSGGQDARMEGKYLPINGRQTFAARLQTLVNIVRGVTEKKHATPALAELGDACTHFGMVGGVWKAAADRDNRGKVYLYFCPEDMTVALDNVQGIGWQGVPDHMGGTALSRSKKKTEERKTLWGDTIAPTWETEYWQRQPFAELGKGFFQRVFTAKPRLDAAGKQTGPVLVGQAPHDFVLRLKGEDDHAHVAETGRGYRAHHAETAWPVKKTTLGFIPKSAAAQRVGIRTINGEALPKAVAADLRGSGQIDVKDIPPDSLQAERPAAERGPCEEVDPIDAAIAITSKDGLRTLPQQAIDDPRPLKGRLPGRAPNQLGSGEKEQLQAALNQGKAAGDQCEVVRASHAEGGKILLIRKETPNEARLRWQREVSPKSFHGAIFGNAANHANVTAYDVAIGGGKACSDPRFYAYLCAVADWRVKKPIHKEETLRASVLNWNDFVKDHALYWKKEPDWRRELIEGNADYYGSGELPKCLPLLPEGLPSTVVSETMTGRRIEPKNGGKA